MSLTVNRCQTNRFRRTEIIHFFHFIRVFYILDTQFSSFFFKTIDSVPQPTSMKRAKASPIWTKTNKNITPPRPDSPTLSELKTLLISSGGKKKKIHPPIIGGLRTRPPPSHPQRGNKEEQRWAVTLTNDPPRGAR